LKVGVTAKQPAVRKRDADLHFFIDVKPADIAIRFLANDYRKHAATTKNNQHYLSYKTGYWHGSFQAKAAFWL
jgi:hypothetical protein